MRVAAERNALQADKIDTGLIVTDQQEASGVAFIFLTDDDNAIVVASGANMQVGLDRVQLSNIFEAIAQAAVVSTTFTLGPGW